MNNYILGTAGHIDHGKTALIKALTNIDCDTHPQEKKRGITINLGFSFLETHKICVGIIDVPGHADFINTMVSGAFAIDGVLLVISADAGIMPQTTEHMQILKILGINRGVIALTKCDLVGEEMILCLREEISEFTKDSFLENCAVIEVSATSGSGIENLKTVIENCFQNTVRSNSFQNFRLYIDRIFSVHGYGTVITGSTLGGEITVGDKLILLPENKEIKIRKMEQYGKNIHTVSAGSRVAINLTGLEIKDFKKGMVLSKTEIEPTKLLDTKLEYLKADKRLQRWTEVIFLTGTFISRARIHLLDMESLSSGETGFAQIHLETPCTIIRGDKYIIRNSSGEITIGGGEVLDAYPLHHKRTRETVVNDLMMLSENKLENIIYSELQKKEIYITLTRLTHLMNVSKAAIDTELISGLPDHIKELQFEDEVFFILSAKLDNLKKEICKQLVKFHSQNPLDSKGRNVYDFLKLFEFSPDTIHQQLLRSILIEMVAENQLKIYENTYILFNHSVNLSGADQNDIKLVEIFIKQSGYHVPNDVDLDNFRQRNRMTEKRLYQIFKLLVNNNKIYSVQGSYINASIIDKTRELVLRYLLDHPDGVTVSKFRDLIEGNRKICLLLLNLFDKEGITFREGDFRKLTNKGLKLINEK